MTPGSRQRIFLIGALILLQTNDENQQATAFEDNCWKDMDATNLFCNQTGDLKTLFCPLTQTRVKGLKITPITCSTNKAAQINITLNGKPLPSTASVRDHGCNKTVNFRALSVCYNGIYKCSAKDVSGTVVNKEAKVLVYGLGTQLKFTFELENANSQHPNELILGTTMNLTCSVSGADWKSVNNGPLYWFSSVNSAGKDRNINESYILPKKYFYTHLEYHADAYSLTFIRKLQVARINESDSLVYGCTVRSELGDCTFSKTLNLTTRQCKRGHFCMANSSIEQPCPPGTYSNRTGVFYASSCHVCPNGFYCPEGSIEPLRCPSFPYSVIDKGNVFPLKAATSKKDCQRCPIKESCDQSQETCKFICSSTKTVVEEGQRVELKCKLSKRSLVSNLVWRRGSDRSISNAFNTFTKGNYFYLVIKDAKAEHSGNYTCEGTETWMNTTVYDSVNLRVIPGDGRNLYWIIGVVAMLIVVTALAGFLLKKFRSRSRRNPSSTSSEKNCLGSIYTADVTEQYWPESSRRLHAAPIDDPHHDYDVFICYSSQDKEWVRKTLLPTLLSCQLRVCIDYKDFAPGAHIIKNIADAIDRSRVTIAVLSPDYVVSAWCNEELQMALGRIGDQHQVIPLMYRMCEVPNFLHSRTYLDWCNPDIKPLFWDQLIKAINEGNWDLQNNDVFESEKNSRQKSSRHAALAKSVAVV